MEKKTKVNLEWRTKELVDAHHSMLKLLPVKSLQQQRGLYTPATHTHIKSLDHNTHYLSLNSILQNNKTKFNNSGQSRHNHRL